MWIEDTGVMVHNTPHLCGMTNITKPVESDYMKAINGQKMEQAAIVDVKGLATNRNGQE